MRFNHSRYFLVVHLYNTCNVNTYSRGFAFSNVLLKNIKHCRINTITLFIHFGLTYNPNPFLQGQEIYILVKSFIVCLNTQSVFIQCQQKRKIFLISIHLQDYMTISALLLNQNPYLEGKSS